MSDFYETKLKKKEEKDDLLHLEWNRKYYAYVEAFKTRLKSEDDVKYNDWVDTLDELLDLVGIHHRYNLKVRITRYQRPLYI